MNFVFKGPIWYWKGPAPWYFVTVPEDVCEEIKDVSGHVTYGWGMIPVDARIGKTKWYTAMFPKDGRYVLPIKTVIRKAESIEEGDEVSVSIDVRRT
jgi:hypothetical protein